jgi:hypothetical protein
MAVSDETEKIQVQGVRCTVGSTSGSDNGTDNPFNKGRGYTHGIAALSGKTSDNTNHITTFVKNRSALSTKGNIHGCSYHLVTDSTITRSICIVYDATARQTLGVGTTEITDGIDLVTGSVALAVAPLEVGLVNNQGKTLIPGITGFNTVNGNTSVEVQTDDVGTIDETTSTTVHVEDFGVELEPVGETPTSTDRFHHVHESGDITVFVGEEFGKGLWAILSGVKNLGTLVDTISK